MTSVCRSAASSVFSFSMHAYFWIFSEVTPLILATAALFFFLAWRWRGQKNQRDLAQAKARLEAEASTLHLLTQERDTARKALREATAYQTQLESHKLAAEHRMHEMERDLVHLYDLLQETRRDPA
jgi:biopolymer transport protein ExbB/TolQ